jgi:multidrug efflux pump subunit AcrA (membrane-fusion protein)
MTKEELDALDEVYDTMMEVQRNPTGAWQAIQDQAAAITALRAQLAEAQAERDTAREWLGAANNEFGSATWDWPDLWRRVAKLKELSNERWQRAERAEAALTAQIEVDAAICTDIMGYDCMKADGETYQPMWVQKVAKGMVSLARQDIRNQPHDRTALDRMLAEAREQTALGMVEVMATTAKEAREKALREAVDALRAHPASRCSDNDVSIWFQNTILALIEKEKTE